VSFTVVIYGGMLYYAGIHVNFDFENKKTVSKTVNKLTISV